MAGDRSFSTLAERADDSGGAVSSAFAGRAPVDLTTGSWADALDTLAGDDPGEGPLRMDEADVLSGSPLFSLGDIEEWEPFGEATGPVVSPAGRTCGELPSSDWVRSWLDGCGLGNISIETNFSSYSLTKLMVDDAEEEAEEEVASDSVEYWFGTNSLAGRRQTEHAAALLASTRSAEVIEALRAPLGIFGLRLRVDLGLVSSTLTLPVLDPTTTPMRRARRRMLPVDEQVEDWSAVKDEDALDADSAAALVVLKYLIAAIYGVADFEFRKPYYEPSAATGFDGLEDHPYSPYIGVISDGSGTCVPVAALHNTKSIAGLSRTMLAPLRGKPEVMALPLNWRVSGYGEFLGPLTENLLAIEDLIASETDTTLGAWLEALGLASASEVEQLTALLVDLNGQTLAVPAELAASMLAAAAKIEEERVKLWEAYAALDLGKDLGEIMQDMLDGFLQQLDEATVLDELWEEFLSVFKAMKAKEFEFNDLSAVASAVGGAVTSAYTTESAIKLGMSVATSNVTAIAIRSAVWLLGTVGSLAGDQLEKLIYKLFVAINDALEDLASRLQAAGQAGLPVNDAIFLIVLGARNLLSAVSGKSLWKAWLPILGTIEVAVPDISSAEERLLFDLGEDAGKAFNLAFAGNWYDSWLQRMEARVEEMSPVEAAPMQGAVEQLREAFDGAVPAYGLSWRFFDAYFEEFDPYPWYRFQAEVRVNTVGELVRTGGRPKVIANWVEAMSPLYQLVEVIDVASAILEAGMQAESNVVALSGAATAEDSLGQVTRSLVAAAGWSKLHEVMPGASIARFAAALWRQSMIDVLLADIEAAGYDLEAAREIVPWMAPAAGREGLDWLLGEYDPAMGLRRYEEGKLAVVGNYGAEVADGPEKWNYYNTLDQGWAEISCDDHPTWQAALATLLDREGLWKVRDLLDAAATTDYGDLPEEPEDLSEWAEVTPFSEVGDLLDGLERFDDAGLVSTYVDEAIVGSAWEVYASMEEVVVGPFFPMPEREVVGSVDGWSEVLADDLLFEAMEWGMVEEAMGASAVRDLRGVLRGVG